MPEKRLFFLSSAWKVVSDTMHKAFWDNLETELNDNPPIYGQAIKLLEEIREVCRYSLLDLRLK